MLLQKHKMKLLFTVLLLILGSFILIYISNQNKTKQGLLQENWKLKIRIEDYTSLIRNITTIPHKEIAKQVYIISKNRPVERINSKTLYVCIPSSACGSCVQSLIVELKKTTTDYEVFIITSDYNSDFHRFCIANGIDKSNCFKANLSIIENSPINSQIIVFKLDKNYEIMNYFTYDPRIKDCLSLFL